MRALLAVSPPLTPFALSPAPTRQPLPQRAARRRWQHAIAAAVLSVALFAPSPAQAEGIETASASEADHCYPPNDSEAINQPQDP